MESLSKQPSPAKTSLELVHNRRPAAETKQRQVFSGNAQNAFDSIEFEDKLTLKQLEELSSKHLQSDGVFASHPDDGLLVVRGGDDGAQEAISNFSALAEHSEFTFGVLSSIGQIPCHGVNNGGELSVLESGEVSHFKVPGQK